ncbi:hypothetical protein ACFV2X_25370 [Streptomyces sp. NPDC059679]|uniref:hypothetical protein n=1 Tax=Streptomyces sp. NPDC059679 TaxID=3346903 RepID=UPI0036BF6CC1
MTMSPRPRKAALTAHVISSVGWFGAVAAYTALDIAAVTARSADTVRGAYVAMELTVSYVIVPLALASLATGIVQSLGTSWGLLRHYWVVVKLLLTVVATGVLLVETQPISRLADMAAASGADPRDLPGTLPHSIGGLVVLLTAVLLSVFKPRGLTRYGWRKHHEERTRNPASRRNVAASPATVAVGRPFEEAG